MKNGLYKQPGSRFWWVQFRAGGKTVRQSTRCVDLGDAKAERAKLVAATAGGAPVVNARRVTYEDLVALLVADHARRGNTSLSVGGEPSADHYKLKHLRAAFAGARAADITTVRVDAWQAARRAAGASQSTVNGESALLRRMFALAVKKEVVGRAPVVETPDAKNARTGFFGDEAFGRLHAALPAWLAPVAEFAYWTGWRKQEVLGLTWDRVDWRAGVARLDPNTTKNDEGRTFPFLALPALAALMRARHAAADGPWVFHHRGGRRIRDFYGAWRAACAAARTEGMLFHDLRRTAVRNLVRAGVTEHVCMKLTGHKTREIFSRYDIVDDGDQRDAVGRLAAAHGAPEAGPTRPEPRRLAAGRI